MKLVFEYPSAAATCFAPSAGRGLKLLLPNHPLINAKFLPVRGARIETIKLFLIHQLL